MVIFGVAIVKSKLLSRWIGGAGVIIGAVTIYAGIEVAYFAFGYDNIHDSLFYLGWNFRGFYVAKINVKD